MSKSVERYMSIQQYIANQGCKLLTTEKEFTSQNLRYDSRYKIISKCGHENTIQYESFRFFGCGKLCKECVHNQMLEKLLNRKNVHETEYHGFCLIREKLTDFFHVKKMVEGTRADFAIKPLSQNADQWMPIQLKATIGPKAEHYNNYAFQLGNKYPNMAVVFVSVKDQKVWLIEGNDILDKTRISIGSIKSKYNKHFVMDFEQTFSRLYEKLGHVSFIEINNPVSKQNQQEHKYRLFREQKLPLLKFHYPEREGLQHDVIVNGLKIQDKVASQVKKRNKLLKDTYYVNIHRSGRGRLAKRYKQGDNDFYWIQVPDTSVFFIIPEKELLDRKIVSNPDCNDNQTNQPILYFNVNSFTGKYSWLLNFKYDYKTTPQEVIQDLFTIKPVVRDGGHD